MRTLVAHGIIPDVIVGTSIGAVVGGCYAAAPARYAGKLGALAHRARRARPSRHQPVRLRPDPRQPSRRASSKTALPDIRIDDLPLRFAAIATEFNTGHEIWLTRGRLSDALRASYALPGIFPPVLIGGRWLVDGALVNPVPVSAARALGARLVIAVNLNSDLFGRGTIIASHGSDEADDAAAAEAAKGNGLLGMFGGERMLRRQFLGRRGQPSIPTVMIEAFNVMQDRITRARLAGDPPDVMVSPRLGRRRLVRFPPRRGSDRHRRGSDRKGDRGRSTRRSPRCRSRSVPTAPAK